MKLESTDFFLCRFAARVPGLLQYFGDIETDMLGSRLADVDIDRPVFITGLARSGTTILLNLFSQVDAVGTHRYKDFPFLWTPVWWNWCTDRLSHSEAAVERPHKDRIRITKESPDAFEEPLWRKFFPRFNDPETADVLGAADKNTQFDDFFRAHVRKILLLRAKQRYVSKGNYNLTRLLYLGALFPDARFVVPIRHPLDHVRSLVRQHQLFCEYSAEDPRVPEYLRAAGHFEFGPQRSPINIESASTRRVLAAWREGNDALGYAIAWRELYGYAASLGYDKSLAGRIEIVRYEDLCRTPLETLQRLFAFCGFADDPVAVLERSPEVSAPPPAAADSTFGDVWREVEQVARQFGYLEDGSNEPLR